jgi:hypothetical protein
MGSQRMSIALAVGALGCSHYYRAPEVPPNQLATVTVDSRAILLSVDGLPPPPPEWKERSGLSGGQSKQPMKFPVGTGCRTFIAKYEESFVLRARMPAKYDIYAAPPPFKNFEVRKYETTRPIRFFVPTRAGYTYWVTATLTAGQFLPRVVEIEPSGEAAARFLPDIPCKPQ